MSLQVPYDPQKTRICKISIFVLWGCTPCICLTCQGQFSMFDSSHFGNDHSHGQKLPRIKKHGVICTWNRLGKNHMVQVKARDVYMSQYFWGRAEMCRVFFKTHPRNLRRTESSTWDPFSKVSGGCIILYRIPMGSYRLTGNYMWWYSNIPTVGWVDTPTAAAGAILEATGSVRYRPSWRSTNCH